MAENTENSSFSSGTGPVPSKRHPSPSSDSDSKRICLHDSRGPTPSTSSKAPQNSTEDVEGIFRTTDQELLSNVAQLCTQGTNRIAPPLIDETTLHEASPWIAQEASQVATEQPTLEALPSKTDNPKEETAHGACKTPLEEKLPDINQQIPNPIIEKFTLEVAQKNPLPDAENNITEIISNDIQGNPEKTALGSPQGLSYLAAEQITTNVAESKVHILSQETIQEAPETTTEKNISPIAQEAVREVIERTSPEVSQDIPQINIETPMHKDDQEVLQEPEKANVKEISCNISPATIEAVNPAVVLSYTQSFSQDRAQENTQAGTENITLEVSQEPSQITTEQPRPDIAKSEIHDSSQANKQEGSQVITENTINEEAQKVPDLNTEAIVREVSMESSQLPTKEISRNISPATIEEVTPAVVPSDIQGISQENIQENTKITTEEIKSDVSQEPPQITTEQPGPDTAKSGIHDSSQTDLQEDSQVITEITINEEAQKVPDLNTEAIVREVSMESSQLPTKDKLKETARDTFGTDVEGITPVVASGVIHSASQETVQENAQIATEEIKSEISHTDLPIASDSKPSEARRKSRVVEEKKRGQRLFGGLLSTLSQSSPNGQQRRRLEIEKRQLERAKIRKVQDNVNKAERIAKLNAARIKEHSKFKKESFHIHKANMLAMANFLCTKAEPKLYYKPWELLPEQEEQVKSQIASASAKFKGSGSGNDGNDQVGLKEGEKLNESSKEIVGQPHTEPSNIAVDADAHNTATSVIPPATSDVVDSPNKDSKVEEREREREEHNCEVMVENEEDTVIY